MIPFKSSRKPRSGYPGPTHARRRHGSRLCAPDQVRGLAGTTLAWMLIAATTGTVHAAGDPARGERVFQYCYSCHSIDPNETATLQGPSLVGIVGRRIAAQQGFEYSPAMRAFAQEHDVWTENLLNRYVADPEAMVPKTTMAFRGVEEADERANLLAFLKARPKP